MWCPNILDTGNRSYRNPTWQRDDKPAFNRQSKHGTAID